MISFLLIVSVFAASCGLVLSVVAKICKKSSWLSDLGVIITMVGFIFSMVAFLGLAATSVFGGI